MKLRRVKAVAVKETLQIVRDPRSLMIALLLPLMQMIIFGYGVNLDIQHLPLCVLDQERSQESRTLLAHFTASRYFGLAKTAGDSREVSRALDEGVCQLAVVVPADFSKRLAAGNAVAIQAVVDGTDSNTANIAAGYARSVTGTYSNDLQLETLQRRGGTLRTLTPVGVEARVWFNEELESRNFIVPGIVALVMAIVGAQLTALTIAREWERGTMEQLMSTPVQPLELMAGKLLPYFVVGMVDAAFCLILAIFWFDVPFRGTVATLMFTTSLFLTVMLCIGYLVSVAIRSQVGASQIALLLTMLPTTLLSGFAFPIDQMPVAVQATTYLVSARYYVLILKSIFLKGAGVHELAVPILCLAAYAVVITALAARAFRKTLE